MARDQSRIWPFLMNLHEFWMKHPDWRFGQLVMNLTRDENGRIRDPWEWEEDRFVEAMENFVDESDMSEEELINRVMAQLGVAREVAQLYVNLHREGEADGPDVP